MAKRTFWTFEIKEHGIIMEFSEIRVGFQLDLPVKAHVFSDGTLSRLNVPPGPGNPLKQMWGFHVIRHSKLFGNS